MSGSRSGAAFASSSKFGIVGASGFVVNLVDLHAAAARGPQPRRDRAVPRDLLDRVPLRRRLELLPQPRLDVPLDRSRRRSKALSFLGGLGAGAHRRAARLGQARSAPWLGHGHKTWFVATVGGDVRQLLRQQILDVSLGRLSERRWWWLSVAAFVLIGLLLRLKGSTIRCSTIPGWRQGDTAAIARNFAHAATTTSSSRRPSTTAPPPNYVELELQIVPFLAAIALQALRHPRSLRTADRDRVRRRRRSRSSALFARWLFASTARRDRGAGALRDLPGQRLLLAHVPARRRDGVLPRRRALRVRRAGSSTTTAARRARCASSPCALLALAFLAKQVALLALIPAARWCSRASACAGLRAAARPARARRSRSSRSRSTSRTSPPTPNGTGRAGSCSCTSCPRCAPALTSVHGFAAQGDRLRARAADARRRRCSGPVGLVLLVAGFCCPAALAGRRAALRLARRRPALRLRRRHRRARRLLPLSARPARRARGRRVRRARARTRRRPRRNARDRRSVRRLRVAVARDALPRSPRDARRTTRWSADVYAQRARARPNARAGALIVMGHYDPSRDVLHPPQGLDGRPDPLDAVRRSRARSARARATSSRSKTEAAARATLELCAWLQRFPLLDPDARAGPSTTPIRRKCSPAPKRAGKTSAVTNASIPNQHL